MTIRKETMVSVKFEFPNHLDLNNNVVSIDCQTIGEGITMMQNTFKNHSDIIVDDQGQLRSNILFVKNNGLLKADEVKDMPVKSGDDILILYQLAGG